MPVIQARPVTLGSTAECVPTVVPPISRPVKEVPMKESLRKSWNIGSSPRAWSWAIRAEVPVPHGERSNHPGWIAIACRECRASDPGAAK